MRNKLFLLLLTIFSGSFFSGLDAQNIDANNLSPVLKSIVENVKGECGLNPNQTIKFTNDYVWFLNENGKNTTVNAGNQQKMNSETQKLLVGAGVKFRGYLNDGQFTKLTQMIQAGKLDPAKAGGTTVSTTPPVVNLNPAAKVVAPNTVLPSSVKAQSNVTGLFDQLAAYINVSPEQKAGVRPILQSYDKGAVGIKTKNAGNDAQIQSEMGVLNNQTIPKLKAFLNDDQVGKLAIAVTMQENILSGKNLSQEQKDFIQKLRTQYNMNDVQLMAVILVMVQGKIRGDAINLLAKSNPQAAAQELGKLLQDLDGQLKTALNADQYTKVKSDIEKLIRGQKI